MMKRASQMLLLAFLVASINAQTTTVVNNPSDTGTTTIYYSTCPSAVETTITLSSTLTYCPGNNCHGGPPPSITAAPGLGGNSAPTGLGTQIIDFTTTGTDGLITHYQEFETVYHQACPTCPGGLAPQTFTITEECPCMSAHPSTYIPAGFDTTAYKCDVCAENGGPTTITLTTPCATGPYANQATATGTAGAGVGSTGAGSYGTGASATGVGTTGAGATGADTSGVGTTSVGGIPGEAGSTANDVAPAATYAPGSGVGGSSSNTTVNPPITQVAPGSPGFTGAASRVGTTLSAMFALIGVVTWLS